MQRFTRENYGVAWRWISVEHDLALVAIRSTNMIAVGRAYGWSLVTSGRGSSLFFKPLYRLVPADAPNRALYRVYDSEEPQCFYDLPPVWEVTERTPPPANYQEKMPGLSHALWLLHKIPWGHCVGDTWRGSS